MANVNIATGEVCYAAVDFSWDGCPPFEFRRTWRSGSDRTGPLGHGWTHSLDVSLTLAEHGELVFRDEEGDETRFPPLTQIGQFSGNWDPARPRSLRWTGPHIELTVLADRILVFGPDAAASGRFPLLRIVTPQGAGLDLNYAGAVLRQVSDVFGRQLVFDYDRSARITSIHLFSNSARLEVARYSYNIDGGLQSATDALGNSCLYEYASHLMIRDVNRLGGPCYMEYDGDRRCFRLWKEDGLGLRQLEFDAVRRQTLVTNSRGFSTVYRLNEASQIVEETNALGEVKSVVYDERNRYLATLHEDGAPETVMRVLDPKKREVSEFAPSGAATVIAYNDKYQPVRFTDAAGATWTAEYDDRGNRVQRTTPLGAVWRWENDEAGFPVRILSPSGRDVRVARSSNRLSGTIEDNLGRVCSYSFGIWGALESITKPGGETTRYTYDSLGHNTSIRQPDGSTAYYLYNAFGNIIEYVDEKGSIRRFGYDRYGVIVSRTDALGQIVAFHYDTEHNLTAIVNQKGERCTFEYDALNRQIKQTNFDGRIAHYAYAPDGSVIRTWDPVSSGGFDIQNNADGKQVAVIVSDAPLTSNQYDALNRPVSVEAVNRAGLIWAVDAEGRTIQESCGAYSQEFAYNAAGNRVSLTDTDGRDVRYEFDVRARLTSVDGPGGRHQFTYDEQDRLVTHKMQNGCVVLNAYDVCNQLAATSVRSASGAEIYARRYEYDPAGYVARIWGQRGILWNYEYDALGRLVRASGAAGTFEYAFDATDNWTRSPIAGPMRYEAGNRLTQAGESAFLFDRAGNIIARQGERSETYEYDGPVLARTNRAGAPSTEFSYDALNRRIEKRVGEKATGFRWDAYTILGEQSGPERVTYLFPPASLSPIEMNRGGKSFCYVNDHLGGPVLLLDENGGVAWQADRSPWEEVENIEVASVENPLRLPGQYRDENGLCYNLFRYYDPATARYITPDPIGLAGGLNAYVYPVNPVNQIDPQGLIGFEIPKGILYDNRHSVPVKCTPAPAKPSGCDDPGDPANDIAPDPKGCFKADGKTLRGGGKDDHNEVIKKIADANPGTDKGITQRINQQQVDAAVDRVGRNRPDFQVTIAKERHYVEVDRDSSRGPCHMYQICQNDPKGIVHLIRI